MTWRHLPAPARAIAVTASAAVTAAGDHDRAVFEETVARLAAAEAAGLVLGAVVRLLLEELHPDGVDGDDIRQILDDCVVAAAQWQEEADPHVTLVLLAGALGIYDQDEEARQPSPIELARNTALLVAHLLVAAKHPLAWYLNAAFAEIARTELQD